MSNTPTPIPEERLDEIEAEVEAMKGETTQLEEVCKHAERQAMTLNHAGEEQEEKEKVLPNLERQFLEETPFSTAA